MLTARTAGPAGGDATRGRGPAATARGAWSQRTHGAVIATASGRAIVGYATFGLAFLMRRTGIPLSHFVVVGAVAGLAAFLGNVVASHLPRMPVALLPVMLALTGAQALWAMLPFDVVVAGAIAAGVGFITTVQRLVFDSYIQATLPVTERGGTLARAETVFQLAWVAAGTIAVFVPFTPGPGITGIAVLALAGIIVSTPPLRSRAVSPPA